VTSEPSLGPYSLLRKLGQGGMGEVHLAHDTRLERKVALKLLPAELRDEPERRTRFLREARAVAQLAHPNITQIFEVGEADGRDYIAFELVEGRTLQERIAETPLTVAELVELALPLADAIAYAHERGIVHRDLKAANVMITPRGHPKLLDFGLAKILHEGSRAPHAGKSTTLTLQGAIFGTPGAMSPEQALGKPVDARTDIFSFGSLLYEMAAGRPAFRGATVMEVMDAVIHREPDPLERVRPDLPAEFVACVAKALRKDPAERYQTMNDLAADLRHWKRATDSGLVPPARARRAPWALVAAVGLVALGGLGWLAWRTGSSPAAVLPAGAERRSLAVLPFTNLGASPADASFCAGLHSDVLTRLAKIGALKVIARSSVLEYADSQKPLRQIGEELGVEAILSGAVQRAGDALRLNLTLHDGASEDSLWAESYNRELTSADIFRVQSEIAEAVANALQAELSPDDRRELRGIPTTSDEAYDAYLMGQSLMAGADAAEMRRGLASLESAVALDPRFAPAWAALSEARGTIYWLFEPTNAELLAEAFEAARRTLELDPDLPEGHLRLGLCHYVSRDYDAAMREYEIAERGLPSSAELLRAKGLLYRRTGRWEECARELAGAIELSPRDGDLYGESAITLHFLGRYDEALRDYQREKTLGTSHPNAVFEATCLVDRDHRVPTALLARIGEEAGVSDADYLVGFWRLRVMARDLAGARAGIAGAPERLSSQWHEYPRALLEAITDELAGDVDAARRGYEAARVALLAEIEAHPDDARPHAPLGLALAGLGRREEALDGARRATEMLPTSRDAIVGGALLLDRFYVELRVGALDEAVRSLDAYLAAPAFYSLGALVLDPRLDVLADHAGFRELCEREGVR
jgi:TolB-like protein/Flp pilus assembly protein TadD/predicted Ser/Thr protein kinase